MDPATSSTALVYHSFGKPEEVLQLETLDVRKPGAGEALLKILAAPINPADFGRINGSYGKLAELPAVAGLEGVAEILEVDSATSSLRVGQRVFVPSSVGAWQGHAIAKAETLHPAPETLPLEIAAMGWVNPPTAWKLIHDFEKLQPGDWILQNAATSAVGKLVIQFARHLGFHTANLARSLDSADELKELGADEVFIDDKDAAKSVLEATGGKKPKIALNAVGGSSAYGMCKALADKGTLITYGAMDFEPAPFPTRYLIFNDVRLRGFWVTRFYNNASHDEIRALHTDVFTFMENASMTIDVEGKYALEDFQDALAHATRPGKKGKVLFWME